MVCNICGRGIQNAEANFCEYCGGPLKEHLKTSYQHMPQGQHHHEMARPIATQEKEGELPISFLNWLGTYGILFGTMFIPIVGWAIYLAVLLVWAFSNKTPSSKKNWARVTLIFTVVMIIIVIIYMIILMSSGVFQDILNGNFSMESYEALYKNLYQ